MTLEQERAKPIRDLACNCCGGYTRGRQWWNRDTGYGMCSKCIAWVRSRGMSEEEIRDLYGVEGVHWGVEPCDVCNGKGFTNPDRTANNAFKGADSDPTIPCEQCGGTGKA